jgi:phage tail protein X
MDWSQHLEQKLAMLFPDLDRRASAEAELGRYGVGDHEPEIERVRLAVLKLAGDDLDRLRSNVRAAKGDYRDVLAWAEYPAQMKSDSWRLPEAERQRLQEADQAQYLAWLEQE